LNSSNQIKLQFEDLPAAMEEVLERLQNLEEELKNIRRTFNQKYQTNS
jgi:hypothetical protein